MTLYAIGDIQGCYQSLQTLLDKLNFDPVSDQLWFVGDLVNRGPQSLETLRFIKSLGDSAVTVLGNHDLNLLAVSEGVRKTKRSDTLQTILDAPDVNELLIWLRQRPLLHYDVSRNTALVHAGIAPQWDISTALKRAGEVESVLAGPKYRKFLKKMYGNEPGHWNDDLAGMKRLRFITNAFTRMRYCSKDGGLDLDQKQAPGKQKKGLKPWYKYKQRQSCNTRILFGHWSTLGLGYKENTVSLDTGCLWGGKMTALLVDSPDHKAISIKCKASLEPK